MRKRNLKNLMSNAQKMKMMFFNPQKKREDISFLKSKTIFKE